MAMFQLYDSKSLHETWLEITKQDFIWGHNKEESKPNLFRGKSSAVGSVSGYDIICARVDQLLSYSAISHKIHGTGIFTYMNGWFVWYM